MKRKLRLYGFFLFCGWSFSVSAQPTVSNDSLRKILKQGLQYLATNQQSSTVPGYQFRGEWASFMSMRTSFLLLSKPPDSYDSNCFSTSGIFNSLSSLYLSDTSLSEIPPMLDNAMPRILSFYNGASFNFWPLLPQKGRRYTFGRNKPDMLVRRPAQFKLIVPYIRKAANIMNDNDDTSQGYLAIWNYNQVNRINGKRDAFLKFPSMRGIFEPYRDTARQTAHYYNFIAFDRRESGAYLTWRGREECFPTWNIPRLLINNSLFLTTLSTVYPYAYKSYMPYGANDVDAVLNANVLSTLAAFNELDKTGGVKAASAFIEHKIRRRKWSRAGVYYPNRYHLHYATMRAWKKGVHTLDSSAVLLIKHLKSAQCSDGSYHSRPIVNHRDILQSTAYAFHAMLSYNDPSDRELNLRIRKALNYILSEMHNQNGTVCWDGGVFFSGGTVIRNTLFWKSDGYTTALILEAIGMYLNQRAQQVADF